MGNGPYYVAVVDTGPIQRQELYASNLDIQDKVAELIIIRTC